MRFHGGGVNITVHESSLSMDFNKKQYMPQSEAKETAVTWNPSQQHTYMQEKLNQLAWIIPKTWLW